jgi:hypothetical protein
MAICSRPRCAGHGRQDGVDGVDDRGGANGRDDDSGDGRGDDDADGPGYGDGRVSIQKVMADLASMIGL